MKTAAECCKSSNLQLQIGSFENLQLYFSLSCSFSCNDLYSSFTLPLFVILMTIGKARYIFRRIINLFPIYYLWVFFDETKVLHALLWDLEFSWNWGKKWVPMYTTALAKFSTIVQPLPIFRKLLLVTPICKIAHI